MHCDPNTSVSDFERFRAPLRMLVRLDVDPRLTAKVDLSGVVQQTLLEAHQGRAEYRGNGDDAMMCWLRRILNRNLLDEIRKVKRAGYDATLDRSINELSSRAAASLAADQSSPSTRFARREELLRLANALDQLPEDQQTAVLRHHLQGISLAQVAAEMGRSKASVAGLLRRGLTRLRDLLKAASAR